MRVCKEGRSMKKFLIYFALFSSVALSNVFAKTKVVVVNEDNDHYFKLDSSLMNEDSLKSYIDRMAGGKVTHFFMCPSGQRPSYGSTVWEPIWTGLAEPGGDKWGGYTTWARHAKMLHDKGIDPYQVWIKRCRERGISPWLSPRMNDCHNADHKNPFRSTNFWREHDEYHCEPGYRGMDWNRATFNFALQPVQDYTFAIIKEQLDRYDVDGYELDFMRFSDHFPRGTGLKNSFHLDRFVKRVKSYVDRKSKERGHPILLGVRVASTPKAACSKGCDVGKWVREGWVDWVCASTYWETPCYDMPVKEWREWFGDRADKVMILAGTDHGVGSTPWNQGGVRLDMEMKYYAGFADVLWSKGVDGLYLFNIPYLEDELKKVCRLGLFPEDIQGQLRTYPVSWSSEAWWSGEPDRIQLPKKSDKENTFKIRVGTNPFGRVSVLVGVDEPSEFAPKITLNGFAATGSHPDVMKIRPTGIQHKGVDYTCRRYYFPRNAVHGGMDNAICVGPTSVPKTIYWCEIELSAEDFVTGADVSWVTEMESAGVSFRTVDGYPRDCFQLMKDYGMEAIRLRVWVDPKDGWNNAGDTLAKAKRATAAGMDLMIDFHYSDTWADPGVQAPPDAWRGHDADGFCRDIAVHTKEVLHLLKANGIEPKWVQVGNEVSHGMFWTGKRNEKGHTKWVDYGGDTGWAIDVDYSMGNIAWNPENYARFFKAGYDAVKEVLPDALVIVHIAEGEQFKFTERNLETLRKYGVKWDMVGLSVYPPEAGYDNVGGDAEKYTKIGEKTIDDALENIRRGGRRWKCPYMIVETGVEASPPSPVSVEQSRKLIERLVKGAREDTDGFCKGVFYWEPECKPSKYRKGAFTEDGRPTSIMKGFSR